MKSFGVTLGILYGLLALFNVSFFTILIHENQVDLITRVKKYESMELATEITSEIRALIQEINLKTDGSIDPDSVIKRLIEKCDMILLESQYILFTLDGRVLHESSPENFPFKKEYTWEAQTATTRKEFSGRPYTATFVNDREILFYLPLVVANMDMMVLLFQFNVSEIHDSLDVLYRNVIIFIIFIVVFHLLFGIILHRIVVSPIHVLAQKSDEISKGNYQTRINLKRQDEFGVLTSAFNHMATSIEDKIMNLDKVNARMKIELHMAGEVQKSIYPGVRKTEYFDLAVHHQPLIDVSGDYHDVFDLGDGKYGCIVADVSGHGVAAALITMLIKEKCEEIVSSFIDTKAFFSELNRFFGKLMNSYDKFFTAFYIIIDGKQKRLSYSSASHPHAFLMKEERLIKLNTKGIIIGFSGDLGNCFESKTESLTPGDKIVIFSDGMYEQEDTHKKQFGIKRLEEMLFNNRSLSCEKIITAVVAGMHEFCGDALPSDDETMVIIEIK